MNRFRKCAVAVLAAGSLLTATTGCQLSDSNSNGAIDQEEINAAVFQWVCENYPQLLVDLIILCFAPPLTP